MTPEQQKLLEKANRSLQAARELNRTGFPDFAASRTYYAMFYIATAFLEGEGLSYSKHSAVIAAFGRIFARTNRIPVELHRYLIDAERIRLRADYNTELDISETDVEQLVSQGEEMLNFALGNIDSLPPYSP
ncbi:HEPN domain-containing protein [Roseofilum reptotaenium CS-1145]|uniref:DNA-binding protein n=1 Tax=Roseofilum reptotaenium AO1-A TaxID=1925591 RepID=A0A1L9QY17_9CYAN|nr:MULTISPECIES: HEPN domain-containing protein [Roseofilum]OJJ27581.1 DNA-binding protein [Roseofilum reptotaenium AO1-A]MBP0013675.1 HEPN domain-containing protein [Roseofilum sp. SID3]MBP0023485.1 HEPN domain-containing protein [Roseofilum sp. SID2]MBP0037207.1 HEPN domain-containing protein [Roseofilum sp. SID1]MBP0040950.1 HEPN domain-containing protein [Roseofilum sp. SBFL]